MTADAVNSTDGSPRSSTRLLSARCIRRASLGFDTANHVINHLTNSSILFLQQAMAL